jgi:hypothetical protein
MDEDTSSESGDWVDSFRPVSDFVTRETLNVASSRAPSLDDTWRDASWETANAIADQSMIAYLRQQVAGWSTATDTPTTTERTAEHSVADRAVLGGYVAGRLLVGSADHLASWPADSEVDELYALLDETENMDIAQLPMPAGEPTFLQELTAAAGWPEHENLLSLGAMAFDSALACALLEHDHIRM